MKSEEYHRKSIQKFYANPLQFLPLAGSMYLHTLLHRTAQTLTGSCDPLPVLEEGLIYMCVYT